MKNCFDQKLQFTYVQATGEEHPAHQKMKFTNFLKCLCVICVLLDPDPDTNPALNPDRQHWKFLNNLVWHVTVWCSIVVTYMMRSNARNCVISALKREHTAHQNMKFINCFLCLWVVFVLLVGSGSAESTESGSTALEIIK
jgi:hypothetical protein